jgi:hypothetical protein
MLAKLRPRSAYDVMAALALFVAISLGVPAAHAAAVEAAQVAPPTVHITMNKHGVPKTRDAFDFRPGLIRFSVSGESNCPVWFIRLHDGYAFSDFRHDQYATFEGVLSARQRLWDNSDYRGGAPGRVGQTVTGTVTLPTAGDYVITSFGKHLNRPIRFELTGDPEDRVAADYDSTIVATPGGEWGGDTQLPTNGTLRFTNNDSVPHQLYLQPVDDGTTKEQVLDWFRSNLPGPEPPVWFAPGPRLGMEPLDPGATETHAYAGYAPGTYLAWQELGWEQYPPSMVAIVRIGD